MASQHSSVARLRDFLLLKDYTRRTHRNHQFGRWRLLLLSRSWPLPRSAQLESYERAHDASECIEYNTGAIVLRQRAFVGLPCIPAFSLGISVRRSLRSMCTLVLKLRVLYTHILIRRRVSRHTPLSHLSPGYTTSEKYTPSDCLCSRRCSSRPFAFRVRHPNGAADLSLPPL